MICIRFPHKQLLLVLLISAILIVLFGCGEIIGGVNMQSVTLEWDPSSINEDGSPLIDLKGFRIYYGDESRTYDLILEVSPDTNQCSINVVPEGTWYFSATAYDSYGNQSYFSNEVLISF